MTLARAWALIGVSVVIAGGAVATLTVSSAGAQTPAGARSAIWSPTAASAPFIAAPAGGAAHPGVAAASAPATTPSQSPTRTAGDTGASHATPAPSHPATRPPSPPPASPTPSPPTTPPSSAPPSSAPPSSASPAAPADPSSAPRNMPHAKPAPARPRSSATRRPAAPPPARGAALPLGFSTGNASEVITVTASSTRATTGTLRAWVKVSEGWQQYGPVVTAYLGSDGMSSAPSEWKSATPIGTFTLTRAFGADSDPGTRLPYVHTNLNDWWISQTSGAGASCYNTLQVAGSSSCAFTRGAPNEHLATETPDYNYAVVIDYNTRNTGHVTVGAGSAFFLHVTEYRPTAGCVSIPQSRLLTLMRWLNPADHPRILIGTT